MNNVRAHPNSSIRFLKTLALALAGAALSCAGVIHAVPLEPGGRLFYHFTPDLESDPITGDLIAFTFEQFFVPGGFNGFLEAIVYAESPSNPLGGLTFVYSLVNEGILDDVITRMTVSGFGGFDTDVNWIRDRPPEALAVFFDRSASGDEIAWTFGPVVPGVPPDTFFLYGGFRSPLLVVHTDAHSYGADTAHLTGAGDATVTTLGPALASVPVPEAISSFTCIALITLSFAGFRFARLVED